MARRRSDEARMIDYFTNASEEKAVLMLGLVKDIVNRRTAPTRITRAGAKRARVGKSVVGSNKSTEFNPADIVSVSQ